MPARPVPYVVARLRSFARRHRLLWWSAALGLAALTATHVDRLTDAAAAERARWGELRTVMVAGRDGPAGTSIAAVDVHRVQVPATVAPVSALDAAPPDAVLARSVEAGEILLPGHLVGSGALPEEERGVAVPSAGARPPLSPGDRVELIASSDPVLGGDGTTAAVAEGRVLDVAETAVTVAVPTSDVVPLVAALSAGTVSIVLR